MKLENIILDFTTNWEKSNLNQKKIFMDNLKNYIFSHREQECTEFCPLIQGYNQKYESEIEKDNAARFLKDWISEQNLLKNFWFYKNLVERDFEQFKTYFDEKIENLVFVWAGSLPLTAIFLVKIFGLKVDLIEKDKDAYNFATQIIKKLKLQNQIKIFLIDAQDFENYQNYDAIFLSSFLAYNEKVYIKTIEKIISSNKNPRILARTAQGLEKLIYAPIPEKVFSMLKILNTPTPLDWVINEIVIFWRKQKN